MDLDKTIRSLYAEKKHLDQIIARLEKQIVSEPRKRRAPAKRAVRRRVAPSASAAASGAAEVP